MRKCTLINRMARLSSLAVFVVGCASSNLSHPGKQPPGFLPDYSLLKPVPVESDNHVKLYRYTAPDLNVKNYHAVIVDPVIIYNDPKNQQVESGVNQQTQQTLNNSLREMVSKGFNVVTVAGPGVAHLSVAIAGAELQGEGFKVRNLIPVSAVIKLMTMATGYDNKTAAIEIAAKITDSQSNSLLGASVATISSEKFRNKARTHEEFDQLAQKWVALTVKNAAGYKNK